MHQELEGLKVTQASLDQREVEENEDLKEKRVKRDFQDFLVQKEMRAPRGKMVLQEH